MGGEEMLRRGEGGDAEAGAAKGSWRPKSPTGALKPLEERKQLRREKWVKRRKRGVHGNQ